MKNYIYLILLIIPTFFAACGDSFLEEKPQNFEAPENTYTSTKGFNAALNGLYTYSRLEFQTWAEDAPLITPVAQGACNYEVLQVGLDIAVRSYKDATLAPFETYTYDPATAYIANRWKWAYGLIANANQLINNAEKSGINWTNPATDKLYFQAQGRFFRAYSYRYLTYLYGDVPWVTEVTDKYRNDFVRTPKAEVLQHMIDDLKFAAQHLPADPASVQPGQLTKWAALHMLSEIYLFAGKYDDAKNAALEVINSGYFSLISNRFGTHTSEPGDYYSDMFKTNNHNRTAGNLESIWVVQAEYEKQGGGGRYNDWTRRAWIPRYYNIPGFVISVDYGGRGIGQIRPLEWLLESYESDDVRNSPYNIRRDWYYNSTDPKYADLYGKKHTITKGNMDDGSCFATTTKFEFGIADDPTYEGVSKDKTRFRLAETYLFLAEAYLGLNNQGEAANAINVVRTRAKATPANASEVNIDYLLDERIRELIGEEIRRFTLIRTGKLVERTKKFNPVSGPAIKETNVLWPIPQSVIDANSDVKWENNPGYN